MSIRWKILAAPGVALIFMLLVGLGGHFVLQREQAVIRDMTEIRFANFAFAAQQADQLNAVHSGAYRFFTWIGDLNEAKMEESIKALVAKTDAVIASVKRFEGGALEPEERAVIAKVSETLVRYRKDIDMALDLASGDVKMGMVAMQTADQRYQQTSGLLDQWVKLEASLAKRHAEQAQAEATRMSIMAGAGMLVAVVVVVLASLWLARMIMQQVNEAKRIAEAIAAGDLTGEIKTGGQDELGQLLASLAAMQANLKQMILGIGSSADQVTTAAGQLASASREIAAGSDAQSEAASATAAAVEEVSVSIAQVSDHADEAREVAKQTAEVSQSGLARVNDASQEIRRIESSITEFSRDVNDLQQQAGDIGSIALLIKDIAEQTNLLALNAAIEAARAGEQGRGFAVVADEVRRLAERTAAATNDIKTKIESIQSKTESASQTMTGVNEQVARGVQVIGDLVAPLEQLSTGASRALGNLVELSGATREQSQASNQIAQNVEKIVHMIEENGAAVTQSTQASESLSQLAQQLLGMVRNFKT
jgi:methyl-accepting chemotaxis protein